MSTLIRSQLPLLLKHSGLDSPLWACLFIYFCLSGAFPLSLLSGRFGSWVTRGGSCVDRSLRTRFVWLSDTENNEFFIRKPFTCRFSTDSLKFIVPIAPRTSPNIRSLLPAPLFSQHKLKSNQRSALQSSDGKESWKRFPPCSTLFSPIKLTSEMKINKPKWGEAATPGRKQEEGKKRNVERARWIVPLC